MYKIEDKKTIRQFLNLQCNCLFCNHKMKKKLSHLQNEYDNLDSIIDDNVNEIYFNISANYYSGELDLIPAFVDIKKGAIIFDYDKYNEFAKISFNNMFAFFQIYCDKCEYKYSLNSEFLILNNFNKLDGIYLYSESFILDDKLIIKDHLAQNTVITNYYDNASFSIINGYDFTAPQSKKIIGFDFDKLYGLSKDEIIDKIDVLINFS